MGVQQFYPDALEIGNTMTKTEHGSCESKIETIEIQIDTDLYEQLLEIITPMGLTIEMLIQRFIEWFVHPESRDDAMAWLRKVKEKQL